MNHKEFLKKQLKNKKFREGWIQLSENRIQAFDDIIFHIRDMIENEKESIRNAHKK